MAPPRPNNPQPSQNKPSQPREKNKPEPRQEEAFLSLENLLKTLFKSAVVLPALHEYPEIRLVNEDTIQVVHQVVEGGLYKLYILSLLALYLLAISGTTLATGSDTQGNALTAVFLPYALLDLIIIPHTHRGLRYFWRKYSFQLYWQKQCLRFLSRQMVITFKEHDLRIEHKLLGFVYHQDKVERATIERNLHGGGFIGFFLTPPDRQQVERFYWLRERPAIQHWYEWFFPLPVDPTNSLHFKLFINDAPLNITHLPEAHGQKLHRYLQGVLTHQITVKDLAELKRRSNHDK